MITIIAAIVAIIVAFGIYSCCVMASEADEEARRSFNNHIENKDGNNEQFN